MSTPLSERLLRIARRVHVRVERRLFPHRAPPRIEIGRPHAGGVLDAVEVGSEGTISVVGWSPDEARFAGGLVLAGGDVRLPPAHVFRVLRPDLAQVAGSFPERLGIVAEFVAPAALAGRSAQVLVDGAAVADVQVPDFGARHYGELLGNPGVWHRDDVYGVGPPQPHVSREILDLCVDVAGPALDFGCGAGALVAALRAAGVDCAGLELDTPIMRGAMLPAAAPHVTFYDGQMPSPFAAGAFATVTCCEVLEHIPEYAAAVAEMARLTRGRLLLTVPDMSSIPRGLRHGVVPWHLLERSHVNFFTQASLAALLAPHFSNVRFARIGEVRCDRLRFYTSLVAICTK